MSGADRIVAPEASGLQATITESPVLPAWVGRQMPKPVEGANFGPCVSLAITKDGRPVAGIVYHNWDREAETCEVSAAARPGVFWMTRPIICRVFDFPFRTCQMVWARHRLDSPIRRMWKRFGGKEVIVERMYGRETDGAIHTFTREEWEEVARRMWRGTHGREGT